MARNGKAKSDQADTKVAEAIAAEAGTPASGFVWPGWPALDFPMPTVADWFRVQQELFWSAAQFGQDMVATAFTEMNQGSGIVQRLMAVKTPQELAACERDLMELASSKYFEQVMKFVERMKATLESGGAETEKPVAKMAGRKKSG